MESSTSSCILLMDQYLQWILCINLSIWHKIKKEPLLFIVKLGLGELEHLLLAIP